MQRPRLSHQITSLFESYPLQCLKSLRGIPAASEPQLDETGKEEDVLQLCSTHTHAPTPSPLIFHCLCPPLLLHRPTSRFQTAAWISSWFHPAERWEEPSEQRIMASNTTRLWSLAAWSCVVGVKASWRQQFSKVDSSDKLQYLPPDRLERTPLKSPLHPCFYPFSEKEQHIVIKSENVFQTEALFLFYIDLFLSEATTWKKASTCCCGTSPVSAG